MAISRPDIAVRPSGNGVHASVAASTAAVPPSGEAALAFVQSVDREAAWSARRIRGFLSMLPVVASRPPRG